MLSSTEPPTLSVQSQRIESRPRALQRAIHEVRTLPLIPPKGGSKRMNIRRAAIYRMFLECVGSIVLNKCNNSL